MSMKKENIYGMSDKEYDNVLELHTGKKIEDLKKDILLQLELDIMILEKREEEIRDFYRTGTGNPVYLPSQVSIDSIEDLLNDIKETKDRKKSKVKRYGK